MAKKTSDDLQSGIVLLAKHSGLTSFSSLFSIKRALDTGKVGHTGTLDSFADGLLVVLVGRLTRLVPHITNFDKTYLALVEFGSETDTLEPSGKIIKNGRIPSKEEVQDALKFFEGEIDQTPPMFSALHVDGKRLSDLAREGKTVEIKSRKIKIHSIELLDFKDKYALIEVRCSKGTYIRCLARDIAQKIGTCAHLRALRRTSVGPYQLCDAVDFENLEDFTIDSILSRKIPDELESVDRKSDEYMKKESELQMKIRRNLRTFDFACAAMCGMESRVLKFSSVEDYRNGRPVKFSSFYSGVNVPEIPESSELAVFYPDCQFAGCMTKKGKKLQYGFVIPPSESKLKIYSWEQICGGKFDETMRQKGIAATIGSFDGSHLGHDALYDAVLAQEDLVPGVITFTKSLRGLKDPEHYHGDVVSLRQKLESFSEKGFRFAIVIDFSDEFGKLKGRDFLNIVIKNCGLKYLAEGKDFHCGYKGQTDMNMMAELGISLGFRLDVIDSVLYKDEKVSSSRIRDCILDRNLEDVEYMLKSKFAYDCSDLTFRLNGQKSADGSSGKAAVYSAEKSGCQILLPDGDYRVVVEVIQNSLKSGEAQNVRAYKADCTLDNGALHLAFSDNLISGFVRTINFGYPEEK